MFFKASEYYSGVESFIMLKSSGYREACCALRWCRVYGDGPSRAEGFRLQLASVNISYLPNLFMTFLSVVHDNRCDGAQWHSLDGNKESALCHCSIEKLCSDSQGAYTVLTSTYTLSRAYPLELT